MKKEVIRCWNTKNPLYIQYHDNEWGFPTHDDVKLFEFFALSGFQAGLSWELILNKRDAFRKAFDTFEPERISCYTEKEIERIMCNSNVIRNKTKILATIHNAARFLEISNEWGSFDSFIWSFVHGKTVNNTYKKLEELPSDTVESRKMSRELKRRGFKFAGPKICYAFMQSIGMVNDHLVNCFRYGQIKRYTENMKV